MNENVYSYSVQSHHCDRVSSIIVMIKVLLTQRFRILPDTRSCSKILEPRLRVNNRSVGFALVVLVVLVSRCQSKHRLWLLLGCQRVHAPLFVVGFANTNVENKQSNTTLGDDVSNRVANLDANDVRGRHLAVC